MICRFWNLCQKDSTPSTALDFGQKDCEISSASSASANMQNRRNNNVNRVIQRAPQPLLGSNLWYNFQPKQKPLLSMPVSNDQENYYNLTPNTLAVPGGTVQISGFSSDTMEEPYKTDDDCSQIIKKRAAELERNSDVDEKQQNRGERSYNSEYRNQFRPFSHYDHVDGYIDIKNSLNSGPQNPTSISKDLDGSDIGSGHNVDWYREVVDLRNQANNYRYRGWGADLVPPHINELYLKQLESNKISGRPESISSLMGVTAVPTPRDIGQFEVESKYQRSKKVSLRPRTAPSSSLTGTKNDGQRPKKDSSQKFQNGEKPPTAPNKYITEPQEKTKKTELVKKEQKLNKKGETVKPAQNRKGKIEQVNRSVPSKKIENGKPSKNLPLNLSSPNKPNIQEIMKEEINSKKNGHRSLGESIKKPTKLKSTDKLSLKIKDKREDDQNEKGNIQSTDKLSLKISDKQEDDQGEEINKKLTDKSLRISHKQKDDQDEKGNIKSTNKLLKISDEQEDDQDEKGKIRSTDKLSLKISDEQEDGQNKEVNKKSTDKLSLKISDKQKDDQDEKGNDEVLMASPVETPNEQDENNGTLLPKDVKPKPPVLQPTKVMESQQIVRSSPEPHNWLVTLSTPQDSISVVQSTSEVSAEVTPINNSFPTYQPPNAEEQKDDEKIGTKTGTDNVPENLATETRNESMDKKETLQGVTESTSKQMTKRVPGITLRCLEDPLFSFDEVSADKPVVVKEKCFKKQEEDSSMKKESTEPVISEVREGVKDTIDKFWNTTNPVVVKDK